MFSRISRPLGAVCSLTWETLIRYWWQEVAAYEPEIRLLENHGI